MVIDLNVDTTSSDSYHEIYRSQSILLYEKISKEKEFNYIIMPIHIYNIISSNLDFESIQFNDNTIKGINEVGIWGQFRCFLDMHMKRDHIILSFDKRIDRDHKLNSILNGTEAIKEKRVKIKS